MALDEFFDDDDYIKPIVEVTEDIEAPKAKEKTMFQVMSTIVNKKFVPTNAELKKLNSFIMVRYLSNDAQCVFTVATTLDHYHKMPLKAQYMYARYSLGNKINYINYPKKEEMPNKDDIDIFCTHFKCNEQTAMDYYNRIPLHLKEEIINKYTKIGVLGKLSKSKKKGK